MGATLPIAVLLPADAPAAAPPDALPLGRAALALAAEGVDVVFGDRAEAGVLAGWRATAAGWAPAAIAPAAIYDRYPSQSRPERYAAAVAALAGVPRANPPALVALCRDKLEAQRFLDGRIAEMPEVEDDPGRFAARLRDWGAAFLKPRYGAFGVGVRRVAPGDPLPATGPGLLGDDEPLILQRAVPPPDGVAGLCVRVLGQRGPDGWAMAPGVARISDTDPVANVARGARAAAATDVLQPAVVAAIDALAHRACAALATHPEGDWLVEVGVDVVVAPDGRPFVVEVNGRPRGRLGAVASIDPGRFSAAHRDAAERPLRFLAARARPR